LVSGSPTGPKAASVIDDVSTDSPADKAGLKRSDVIVEFDGERVRSARQFARLVQETPSGRTVKVTITREGQRRDVQVTPDDRRGDVMVSGDFVGDYMRDLGRDFGRLGDHMPPFNFNFDFDTPFTSNRRLGVTTEELTGQLAGLLRREGRCARDLGGRRIGGGAGRGEGGRRDHLDQRKPRRFARGSAAWIARRGQ
jgi:membrane-associated protease RseP (regulator of RpoE activity)